MTSSKSSFLLLLAVLLCCISQSYTSEHSTCNHGQIEQNPGFLDIEEDIPSSDPEGGRTLQSTGNYPNMRIYPYYGFLTSAPSSYVNYLRNDLIPPIIDYFQGALKVKYPVVGNLKMGSSVTRICEMSPPSILKTTGVPADLFLYFTSYAADMSETNIASASHCYLSSSTKRPLVVRIRINRTRLPISTNNLLYHEKNMVVLIHELMHGLAFSPYLYKYFIDGNRRTRTGHIKKISIAGSVRTVIDVPSLTTRVRNFFGCSTIPGLVLEDDGGSGTDGYHLEKKFFVYEAMSSGSFMGQRVSEFSLGLLEASGWYAVDYSYAEPYFFGQGQGCQFINGACSGTSSPRFDEFCTGSSKGCAAHGRGGGYCESDTRSEGCRFVFPRQEYDCDNSDGDNYAALPSLQVFGRGAGSKCFSGSLSTRRSSSTNSFCFKYTCSGSGSSTQLNVQVGKNTIVCTQEEKKSVPGYYGTINCPDPLTFCSTVGKKYCPRNCMGRGRCVNNQCQCNSGYSGVDCALND